MNIRITGRQVNVSERLTNYVNDKIGGSLKVLNIEPLDVDVVLRVEKNPSIARPAVCEVTMRTNGTVIRVEEHEEDLHAAIDVAAAKVNRQLRKFKTRIIDKRVQENQEVAARSRADREGSELDLDALMDELVAEDEEVVRVKETEFLPMTEEQALVQIDLLGHDFFVYTDRDTNVVSVLYRRKNGGYGLLKQANA